MLGIKIGDPVIHVERLLRFNGEPVVLDQIYLIAELFPELTLERLNNEEKDNWSFVPNPKVLQVPHFPAARYPECEPEDYRRKSGHR